MIIAMNSKDWGMILLCTKSAFSKSIQTNGFGRRNSTQSLAGNGEHRWATPARSSSSLPSLAFWAAQIIQLNCLQRAWAAPWLHWPLPCRPRLCFLNLTYSYKETMALKAWVLKSVDNILWSTWVCGRWRPYLTQSWELWEETLLTCYLKGRSL